MFWIHVLGVNLVFTLVMYHDAGLQALVTLRYFKFSLTNCFHSQTARKSFSIVSIIVSLVCCLKLV